MDDRARSRNDLLSRPGRAIAVFVPLLAGSCAPAPRVARPSVAPLASRPEKRVSARPAAADPDFPVRPDYASHLAELGSFVSLGHAGGRYHLRLFANAAATRAWQSRATAMPVGALFAAAHRERGAAGPLFVMQKRAPGYDPAHGDWYYAVADSAARRVLRQGRLADCATCHATSPTDYVFIRPRARR